MMSRTSRSNSLALAALVCVFGAGCERSVAGTAEVHAGQTSSTIGAQAAGGGMFSAPEPWTADVSASSVSDRSDAVIAALSAAGGWGNGNTFQTDFAITIFEADRDDPRVEVVGSDQYCYSGPDCDTVPSTMPVPADATVEGSEDLSCDISGDTEG